MSVAGAGGGLPQTMGAAAAFPPYAAPSKPPGSATIPKYPVISPMYPGPALPMATAAPASECLLTSTIVL